MGGVAERTLRVGTRAGERGENIREEELGEVRCLQGNDGLGEGDDELESEAGFEDRERDEEEREWGQVDEDGVRQDPKDSVGSLLGRKDGDSSEGGEDTRGEDAE